MLGLLEKARQLRTTLPSPPDGREEFAFDPDSGITREEQGEIRAEIERVATASRIAASPEMFAVKAAKRGVLFPVVVNAAALVVLAVGLGVFYFLFQRGETQLSREDTATITAEGKLLAEVKKESEARILQKNQQIDQIQGRLADIDKQRLDLQATMDTKVQEKEAALRATLAAELDAEKARLQKQGLSDQDIQAKLADLEAQKNAAFTKQLDDFKTQATADRQKSEATLKALQAQYNSDLAKANTERQQVLSDSKQREADLQAQLAQRTKELQSAQSQTQQQLTALTSQKQQEDLVAQQLVGLYAVAQTDIAARNYTRALTSLQAIGGYVNSADVAVLPGMAKRRPVDLFIVESLSSLVQGEIDKGKVDSASIVEAGTMIADVRARVAEAEAQLRSGKVAEAEKLYGQALAVIPEISRIYGYITKRTEDGEKARLDALRAGLTRAEAAFASGRSAEMLAAYKDALTYLPEGPARLDTILSNIGSAGAADQTRAAVPLLAKGDAQLTLKSWPEAIATYLALLRQYPQSAQALPALKGINEAVAGMNAAAAATVKAQGETVRVLSDQVSALQKSLADSTGELTRVKRVIMDLLGLRGDPATIDGGPVTAALAKAYGDLATAMSDSSTLPSQLAAVRKTNLDLQKQVNDLSAENDKLRQGARGSAATTTAPLSDADARRLKDLTGLVASYTTYAAQEDSLIASQGEARGLMKTIGLRDTFLGSLNGFFKGLLDRVHRYDERFITDSLAQGRDEGRSDSLKQVVEIVMNLANQKTPQDQKAFFDAQSAAASKDPPLSDFLNKLRALTAATQ